MTQSAQNMVNLTIDGIRVQVKKGTVLIEAARQAGIEIPHYCYDPDLSIVASCRLCLVEIEKVPKLQPSCSTPATEGQVVFTQSEKVLDARGMQMEFLLVQHPLDCPVCDQGGECKLQEYSRDHGFDDTRFRFRRRTFPKPDIGPFIDLERNRCILCTRCVRFLDEKGGNAELAIVSRGNRSMISTFQERSIQNEFAGNTIDLCPVGALTSKVTRFRVRVWELKKANSVCSMCSVGCNIHTEYRNRTHEVLRIEPRLNREVNHRWICDIGRFGFDQFNSQARVRAPKIRTAEGEWEALSWAKAINRAVDAFREGIEKGGPEAVAGIIGPKQSNETLFLFQQFFREIVGSENIDHRTEHEVRENDDAWIVSLAMRAANRPLEEIRRASHIAIIGADLPNELPILRFQVREQRLAGKPILMAFSRSTRMERDVDARWTYHPGTEAAFLAALLKATVNAKDGAIPAEAKRLADTLDYEKMLKTAHVGADHVESMAKQLLEAESPTLLIGESAYTGEHGITAVRMAAALAGVIDSNNGDTKPLSLLLPHFNSRGAADMGCYPHRGPGYKSVKKAGNNTTEILKGCVDGSIQVLFLMGADLMEEYPNRKLVLEAIQKVPTLIVADAYMNETAQNASLMLPLSMYTEEDGTYTNLGGRTQRSERALAQLDGTLAGYQILLGLGERWGKGWRQIRPPRIFDHITQAVEHYGALSWSGLTDQGKRIGIVNADYLQDAATPSSTALPSLNLSPPGEYPWRLTRGRYLFDLSGEKRYAPPLRRRCEPCVAEIHPNDAEKQGIADGEKITLKGEFGSIELPVRISDDVVPGCVTALGRYEDVHLNSVATEEAPWVSIQQ